MNNELERTRLSLFAIKSDLRGLVEQRCDAMDRQAELNAAFDASPAQKDVELVAEMEAIADELAVLDGLIRQYIGKELEKIDATAHVILDLTARSQIHKQESERLAMIAANEDATVKRIKELVLIVMEEFGEKKLRGAMHDLTAVGNGGVQALTIAQPDLIPNSMKIVAVKLPKELWCTILAQIKDETLALVVKESHSELEAPDNSAIRQRLEAGEGVPGCRLEPRGKHLRVK